ncbi:MAG: patatin family protein [Clostridia bacterium]|nr:patatin family protein [Clostridia bacterium]
MKIGLVCPGGGMKGIYGAGVLDVFIDNNIKFDYCISASAGAANAVTFLANQRDRTYRFYSQHSKSPEYMSLKNFIKTGSYFGLDYIYGKLTYELDPLDFEALHKNETSMEIVITNYETGESEYFDLKTVKKGDCKLLMASSALPAICRPIEINGKLYCDGGLSDPVPIKRALDKGCDKIVLVTSNITDGSKKPEKFQFLYPLVFRKYPKIAELLRTRHIKYNEAAELIKSLEKEGKIIKIWPSENIKSNMLTQNPKTLEELYELGKKDAEESLRLL